MNKIFCLFLLMIACHPIPDLDKSEVSRLILLPCDEQFVTASFYNGTSLSYITKQSEYNHIPTEYKIRKVSATFIIKEQKCKE